MNTPHTKQIKVKGADGLPLDYNKVAIEKGKHEGELYWFPHCGVTEETLDLIISHIGTNAAVRIIRTALATECIRATRTATSEQDLIRRLEEGGKCPSLESRMRTATKALQKAQKEGAPAELLVRLKQEAREALEAYTTQLMGDDVV